MDHNAAAKNSSPAQPPPSLVSARSKTPHLDPHSRGGNKRMSVRGWSPHVLHIPHVLADCFKGLSPLSTLTRFGMTACRIPQTEKDAEPRLQEAWIPPWNGEHTECPLHTLPQGEHTATQQMLSWPAFPILLGDADSNPWHTHVFCKGKERLKTLHSPSTER